jgi:DNA-binding transcriptional LysR family regulator
MLIISGGYVGFLPKHVATKHVAEGVLRELDQFAHDSVFSVVTRKLAVQDRALRSFVRLIRTHVLRSTNAAD